MPENTRKRRLIGFRETLEELDRAHFPIHAYRTPESTSDVGKKWGYDIEYTPLPKELRRIST